MFNQKLLVGEQRWKTKTALGVLGSNDTAKDDGGLGFKDFELFNLSLLAKQAWRLHQSPDSLSGRILKVVYYPGGTILDAQLGSRPSQVWRSILGGRDVLKQGIIKRIGDGTTTKIWSDNWIPRDEMLRPYGCIIQDPPKLVSELIDHTTAIRDMDKLSATFLTIDVPAIRSIPLCTRILSDSWAWHFERSGQFTVKSCYRMMVETKRRREAWLEGNAGSSSMIATRHPGSSYGKHLYQGK